MGREQELLTASTTGDFTTAEQILLYDQDLDINYQDYYKKTAFFMACQNGHLDIVTLFLADPRTNLNIEDRSDKTPFFAACANRRIEIINLLLEHSEKVDVNKSSPLTMACRSRNHDEIAELLANDPRINVNEDNYGDTPLQAACAEGIPNKVITLLKRNDIDVNKGNPSPLYLACKNRQTDIVKLLLAHKNIDVEKALNEGNIPLLYLISEQNSSEIVGLLIAAAPLKADLNKSHYGRSPLYVACMKGHFSVVEILLKDRRCKDILAEDNHSIFLMVYKNLLLASKSGISDLYDKQRTMQVVLKGYYQLACQERTKGYLNQETFTGWLKEKLVSEPEIDLDCGELKEAITLVANQENALWNSNKPLYAAQLFGLISLVDAKKLEATVDTSAEVKRFLNIVKQVPSETKMKISNHVFDIYQDLIPENKVERALKSIEARETQPFDFPDPPKTDDNKITNG